jgi:hypothetical protein
LLSHGPWFSLGTPASSTTKTGRHDIAEILLNVALSTKNQIKSYKKYSIIIRYFGKNINACNLTGNVHYLFFYYRGLHRAKHF